MWKRKRRRKIVLEFEFDTGQIHIAKLVKIILFVDHVGWITRSYYDGELIYRVVYKALPCLKHQSPGCFI